MGGRGLGALTAENAKLWIDVFRACDAPTKRNRNRARCRVRSEPQSWRGQAHRSSLRACGFAIAALDRSRGGAFKKHNLDFDLVYVQAAAAAAAALIGGDAEIGLTGGIAIVRAYLQGIQDFVLIGANKNILTHSIVARPEIKRPQDLKGKRLGVFRFGSNNHYFVLQALPRYGLDPNRDVILRQTTGGVADVAALVNGSMDASVMLTYGESAVAQGFHYLIYGPELRVPYAAAVFVTRQAVLERRPQVIAQFMRAMAEAAKIFHTDRAFTYKVLAKYLRINDPKIVERSTATKSKRWNRAWN